MTSDHLQIVWTAIAVSDAKESPYDSANEVLGILSMHYYSSRGILTKYTMENNSGLVKC